MNIDQIIQQRIDAHNADADRTNKDLEPWARLVAAAAMAAVGAAVVVALFTPCESGHLCAGLLLAPAHTVRAKLRGSWLHRMWLWPMAVYLRVRIVAAQNEVDDMLAMIRHEALDGADLRHAQAQIKSHLQWIAARQIKLIDIDLATRRA